MRSRHLMGSLLAVAFLIAAGCTKSAQTTEATPTPTETATTSATETPTAAAQTTSSAATTPTPKPSSTVAVSFTDIKGSFAEKPIIAEAQLGVFGTTTGPFKPDAPITRGDFVKWLVKANNAYYADNPSEQIRPAAQGGPSAFVDVPPSHPDYPYIQALADAGFVIGVDAKHFAPDRTLTREQMIAIKVGRDLKGDPYKNTTLADVRTVYPFADVEKINKRYWDAFYGDDFDGSKNVPRVFGALKNFNPQRQVTRAEAALCIDKVGNYSPRTAEQVANPTPAP